MVVSGAKVEQNIDETVEAVEVISADEIANMGAKNVAEVMASKPCHSRSPATCSC